MSEMRDDVQGSTDVPTAERRRAATVSTAPDGLPIVTFDVPLPVSNEAAVAAIRDERASR